MSYKKGKARESWIEFMGLRFFRQKMAGRVSRKELVGFIRRFFTSRGLEFKTLQVEFRATRRPTAIIDGRVSSVAGCMYPGNQRIEIFLGAITFCMTPLEIMQTIAHEIDHEAWDLEGKKFNDSLPYRQRSHEKRAYATGDRVLRRYKGRF